MSGKRGGNRTFETGGMSEVKASDLPAALQRLSDAQLERLWEQATRTPRSRVSMSPRTVYQIGLEVRARSISRSKAQA